MLGETSTTDISKVDKPKNFSENIEAARKGGEVAGIARKALEERTGKSVISDQNAAKMRTIVTELIEGINSKSDNEND